MQNILINMCEKLYYDRLRNDRALGIENLITTTPRKRTTRATLVALGDPFQTCTFFMDHSVYSNDGAMLNIIPCAAAVCLSK